MVFDKAKLYTDASSIKDPIGKLQGRLWSLLAQIKETSKAVCKFYVHQAHKTNRYNVVRRKALVDISSRQ